MSTNSWIVPTITAAFLFLVSMPEKSYLPLLKVFSHFLESFILAAAFLKRILALHLPHLWCSLFPLISMTGSSMPSGAWRYYIIHGICHILYFYWTLMNHLPLLPPTFRLFTRLRNMFVAVSSRISREFAFRFTNCLYLLECTFPALK